jgi:hypothetical protein
MLFIVALVVLPILASGCGKTKTEVQTPNASANTSETENVQSAVDSGPKVAVVADNSTTEQLVSAESEMPSNSVPTPQPIADNSIPNLDIRLQEALTNFHLAVDKVDRYTIANDIAKLADAGVPKPQIASTLGSMFRDENSVEVKTDILDVLGDLDDPSAFEQIVPGLDTKQPDEVRVAAIEALNSLDDKRAIAVLQPLLTDRDGDVRDAAQSAINSLNSP